MASIDERIAALEAKLKQEKAKKQQIEARKRAALAKVSRQQDTRRKILVGAAILAKVERGEWPKDKLLEAGIPEALIEYSVSKGAVEKAAKDAAERGKGAAAARAAIERLRDAGCVKESSFIKYEARK